MIQMYNQIYKIIHNEMITVCKKLKQQKKLFEICKKYSKNQKIVL